MCGMRSWISATSSLVGVVIIAKVRIPLARRWLFPFQCEICSEVGVVGVGRTLSGLQIALQAQEVKAPASIGARVFVVGLLEAAMREGEHRIAAMTRVAWALLARGGSYRAPALAAAA
jgi:hypothetical protein